MTKIINPVNILEKMSTMTASQMASAATMVYVSPTSGSDVTGTGDVENPYATISFARTQITNAGPNHIYSLFLNTDIYNEMDLQIDPYVFIIGNNSIINLSNSVILSSNWSTVMTPPYPIPFYIQDATIHTAVDVDLNFTALPQQVANLSFTNVTLSNVVTFSVTGNGVQAVNFTDFPKNNGFTTGLTTLNIRDVVAGVFNGGWSKELTITNTLTPVSNILISNYFYSQATSIIADLGFITDVTVYGSCLPGSVTLDGAGVALASTADLIELPTLLNGAIYVPLSISNSIQANYTPVNYTPTDSSVYGNLVGIDNELGALSVGVFPWVEVTIPSMNMSPNTGYITNYASVVMLSLPAVVAQGTIFRVSGLGVGGWQVLLSPGQSMDYGNQTIGTVSLSSTNQYDTVEFLCVTADTFFVVQSSQGNLVIL